MEGVADIIKQFAEALKTVIGYIMEFFNSFRSNATTGNEGEEEDET